MPAGRPTDYREDYPRQAEVACKLGATDQDLADLFDANVATVRRWAARHPEFRAALKVSKEHADDRVVRSLYQRAIGYALPVKKIVVDKEGNQNEIEYTEHMPPDPTSCIFWLKNRRPDEWRDKRETVMTGDGFSLVVNEKAK